MTLIETAPPAQPTRRRMTPRSVTPPARRVTPQRPSPRGPAPVVRPRSSRRRPVGAPMRYRGTGVLMARGPHRRRPIAPGATAALALLAALITLWLGLVAQFGAAINRSAAPVPDRLGVVRVEPGETLQHLASRVAPDAPAGQVSDRIRELNRLDSVALAAGQTLIAPIG